MPVSINPTTIATPPPAAALAMPTISPPDIAAPQPDATVAAEAVNIEGVAAMLSISRRSAEGLAAEGRLPEPSLSVQRIHRWWRVEILAWLLNQCPSRARWAGMREAAIRRYLSAKGV